MDPLPDFKDLPLMPPVATFGDSSKFSLDGAGGDSGMGGLQHSPVVGSKTHLVPKLGCPRKEFLGEDRDGSKVLC